MAAATGAVLVGVGSTRNLALVRLAAREAAAHRRPLHLVHAFNWAATFGTPPVAEPRAEAEELLSRAATAANEEAPALPVSGEIAEGGPVALLVRRSAAAYLVAVGDGGMSTGATSGPADAPAVQVAARADCPVLITRRDPPPSGPVLVGVDGSPSTQSTLDWAYECARSRAARLLVVRVVEANDADDPDVLTRVVASQAARYPQVTTECRTLRGDPGTILIEQSRSCQLTLIAARGDQAWRGMLGAVSQSVLYHADSPVIVVRGIATGAGT